MNVYSVIILSCTVTCCLLATDSESLLNRGNKHTKRIPGTSSSTHKQQQSRLQDDINRQIEEDMQKEIEMLIELDSQEESSLLDKVKKTQQDKDADVELEFKKELDNAPKEQTVLQTLDQVYETKPIKEELKDKKND